MGKILSLLIGGVITVLGLILLTAWWNEILFILRGVIPPMLILCGVIAIAAGISEFKDKAKAKNEKK